MYPAKLTACPRISGRAAVAATVHSHGQQREQYRGQEQRVKLEEHVYGQDPGERTDRLAPAQEQGDHGFGESQALKERVRGTPSASRVQGDPQRAVQRDRSNRGHVQDRPGPGDAWPAWPGPPPRGLVGGWAGGVHVSFFHWCGVGGRGLGRVAPPQTPGSGCAQASRRVITNAAAAIAAAA